MLIALSSPSEDQSSEAICAFLYSSGMSLSSPTTASSTSCAVAPPDLKESKTSLVPWEKPPMASSMRPSVSDVRNSLR